MEYIRIEASQHLKPYVQWFGILQNKSGATRPHSFRIVSDGCPGLIFEQVADSFSDPDGTPFPHLYLHGPATAYSQKTAQGIYCNIIVHFQPQALKAIFGIDAHELTNGFVAVNSVVKNNLSDMLLAEQNTDKKIDLISAFLTRQLINNRHKADQKVDFFIRKTAGDERTLKQIQSELSISERSLERLVKTNIGLSPKLFLRINRFLSTLRILDKSPSTSLTRIAYENAYFDQSHYIREFREFTGAAPKEFLVRATGPLINFPEWQ